MTLLIRSAREYVRCLKSQFWQEDRLLAYQREKLESVLAAARQNPFYREKWKLRPAEALVFRDLPLLERKEAVRLGEVVRAGQASPEALLRDRSSGSTGMPVEFYFSLDHQASRLAMRLRYLRAHGWHPLRRTLWIIFFPQDSPDTAWIRLFHRATRNRFFPAQRPLEEQVQELMSFNPVFLYTLPSTLECLLEDACRRGWRVPALRKVFTGGEVLDQTVRHRTREVLGVEVADNYGSTEAFLAWQCPQGRYHVNGEHVLVEILDSQGKQVAPGQTGWVVLTTLHNTLMPLIRYRIGDLAVPARGSCPCGRRLPLLERLVGRGIQMFRLANGSFLSPWTIVIRLKLHPEISQFQIIQETTRRYRLRYVAPQPLTREARESLAGEFRAVVGEEAQVEFEAVSSIPRGPGGKFLTAFSRLAGETHGER